MNKDDVIVLSELVEIIRKNGTITKGKLWKNSRIGIWKFKEIVKYLPDTYEDIIYSRKNKTYTSRHSLSLFTKEDVK